jgi:hypothetical protein
VDEDVAASIGGLDESKTLGAIVELDCSAVHVGYP